MNTAIVARLRALDDGISRTVTIMERSVCSEAADEIERLTSAIEYAHAQGFEWPADPLPPPASR